jgi:hypothetical protein
VIKPCVRIADNPGASPSEIFNGRQDKIFVPADRHGIHNDDFSGVVKTFIEERLNRDTYGEFKVEDELSEDSIRSPIARKHGAALKAANGDIEWWDKGRLHREDGAAIEFANGNKTWYRNGLRHREDGPAEETAKGGKTWFRNGLLHREGGPAVENADGSTAWYRNNQLHREGGPASESPRGYKGWFLNGEPHREDGPAIQRPNGDKYWFLNGQELTEAEFNKWRSERNAEIRRAPKPSASAVRPAMR